MEYKEYKDGIKLSRLGMGAMRLPIADGKGDSPIDYERAKAIIDTCMRRGVNYYDTAYIYHNGKSEEFLGKALSEYPRDSFYVADKFNYRANPDYKAQFEEQLSRLGMDRIDFYLIHGINDGVIDTVRDCGCIEYFETLKKQGRIRYMGFSFHGSPRGLKRMLRLYKWDFVQIQLNYYDWYTGDAKELYGILKEAGIPTMVMEPAHGGLLAKLADEPAKLLRDRDPQRSLASWAFRWVKSLDNCQVILSGMSDVSQAEDNIATFSAFDPLREEDIDAVRKAAILQHREVAVACTGCRYCCPDCPKGLDIPSLIKVYNDVKIGGEWRISSLMGVPGEKLPTACIGCGSCRSHCPQGFDIPGIMAEMSKILEKMQNA